MTTAPGGDSSAATPGRDVRAPVLVPPPADRARLPEINQLCDLRAGVLFEQGGLRGLGGRLLWWFLKPVFARLAAFNSVLVDHLNRQAAVDDATHQASGQALEQVLSRVDANAQKIETRLDSAVEHVDRRFDDELRKTADAAERLVQQYAAAMDAMARAREPLLVADERRQQALEQVLHAQADLRASIAVLQESAHVLTREVDRLRAPGASAPAPATAAGTTAPPTTMAASSVESYKYVGFENLFRGSAEDVRARQLEYAELFAGAADVLDVGCGRGELIELLRERGITARGVDLNHAMVEICRSRGLDVIEADGLAFLESLPPASIGGLIAAQVVEHLQPDYLLRFLSAAYGALRPGSLIVLETVNVACWFAFFQSYIRDITHVRPLHPDTLSYLLTASGFQQVEVRYTAPYPERDKLQPLAMPGDEAQTAMREMVETINANAARINELLFTTLDYAAIGRRL